MPTLTYKVKGQPFTCTRDSLEECVEAISSARKLDNVTVESAVRTGLQRLDYMKNELPNTPSGLERAKESAKTAAVDATEI